MSSQRANELADTFVAANAEVIEFAQLCSPEQWQTEVSGEEWPVSVVIHHIAMGHEGARLWLETMIRGEPVTITASQIDDNNVDHAEHYGGVTVEETVALLQANGALMEAVLRGLSDEDLARTAPFGPAEGQEMPVAALAEVTPRHALGHLASAREAITTH